MILPSVAEIYEILFSYTKKVYLEKNTSQGKIYIYYYFLTHLTSQEQ